MLPNFPELNTELSRFIFEFLGQRVKFHLGLPLSEIRHHTVFEGPQDDNEGQQLVRHSGEVETSGLKFISSQITITAKELPQMTLDDVLSKVDEVAKNLASEMAKHAYQRLTETLERTGNTIDAKGRKISAEFILEMLSTLQIDFDRNGSPRMPQLQYHPTMEEAVSRAFNELNNNRELKREFKQILVNKKEEWRERETCRKLVG